MPGQRRAGDVVPGFSDVPLHHTTPIVKRPRRFGWLHRRNSPERIAGPFVCPLRVTSDPAARLTRRSALGRFRLCKPACSDDLGSARVSNLAPCTSPLARTWHGASRPAPLARPVAPRAPVTGCPAPAPAPAGATLAPGPLPVLRSVGDVTGLCGAPTRHADLSGEQLRVRASRLIYSEIANPCGVAERDGSNTGCRAQEVVIDMDDAVPNQGGRPGRVPGRRRRVADEIGIAFHFACDQGDLEVAAQLLAILEFMLLWPPLPWRSERRAEPQPLVAAYERLWHLRHSETLEAWA